MSHAITMRQLQKLSAASIERLPGAVPVQSDGQTVALLVPLRPASQAAIQRALQAVEHEKATRTEEEQAELDRFLAEYEVHRHDPAWRQRNGL